MTFFIIFFLPETKGIPVERIHVSQCTYNPVCDLLCLYVCCCGFGRPVERIHVKPGPCPVAGGCHASLQSACCRAPPLALALLCVRCLQGWIGWAWQGCYHRHCGFQGFISTCINTCCTHSPHVPPAPFAPASRRAPHSPAGHRTRAGWLLRLAGRADGHAAGPAPVSKGSFDGFVSGVVWNDHICSIVFYWGVAERPDGHAPGPAQVKGCCFAHTGGFRVPLLVALG